MILIIPNRFTQRHMRKFSSETHRQIGARFRALRKKAGLTQGELGQQVGVSAQQIGKYERGESPTTVADFEHLQWLVQVAEKEPLPSQISTNYGLFSEPDNVARLVASVEKLSDDLKAILLLAQRI